MGCFQIGFLLLLMHLRLFLDAITILLFKRFTYFMYMCVCFAHVCKIPWRPGVLDLLRLEFRALVSCQAWLLGTEFRSSSRAMRALDC